jgi:hypothetical protein
MQLSKGIAAAPKITNKYRSEFLSKKLAPDRVLANMKNRINKKTDIKILAINDVPR